jgi:alpha-L-arabinofuranosidase
LSGLVSGNILSQGNAVIKIDFDRKISAVDPNIYSAFVEPIRTVVYGTIYDPSSPLADVTAVLNEADKVLVVNVVNRHETNAIPTNITMQTGTFTGTAMVSELNGKDLTARSTKTEPAVTVSTREVKFTGNNLNYSFAAHSLNRIEIPIK